MERRTPLRRSPQPPRPQRPPVTLSMPKRPNGTPQNRISEMRLLPFPRASRVALLSLSLPIVAACSQTPPPSPPLPEQNTRLIYPAMPPTKCDRAPAAPAVTASDNDWADYRKARDNAGDDCRAKLDRVDETVSGWPK